MKGFYINLERSAERNRLMKRMMIDIGMNVDQYHRFPAIEPAPQAHITRGLDTRGQLGLWLSLVQAFNDISRADYEDWVLIMEDDTVLSRHAPKIIESLTRKIAIDSSLNNIDMIFLSYFLDKNLVKRLLSMGIELPSSTPYLACQWGFYIACTDAFLVKRLSCPYIEEILRRMLLSDASLLPVDITLRSLFQMGALNGKLLIPMIAAPSMELSSTINVSPDSQVLLSQNAHTILRNVAAGLLPPTLGVARLAYLFNAPCPDGEFNSFNDFFSYFESLPSYLTETW